MPGDHQAGLADPLRDPPPLLPVVQAEEFGYGREVPFLREALWGPAKRLYCRDSRRDSASRKVESRPATESATAIASRVGACRKGTLPACSSWAISSEKVTRP